MSNVFPSLTENNEYIAFGTLRQGNQCLEVTSKRKLKLKKCQNQKENQNVWTLKKDTELLTINNEDCFAGKKNKSSVLYLEKCDADAGHQANSQF